MCVCVCISFVTRLSFLFTFDILLTLVVLISGTQTMPYQRSNYEIPAEKMDKRRQQTNVILTASLHGEDIEKWLKFGWESTKFDTSSQRLAD